MLDGPDHATCGHEVCFLKSQGLVRFVLLVVVTSGAAGCTWFRFAMAYHKRVGLPAYLARETGKKGVVACGTFTFPSTSPRTLMGEQKEEVSRCVNTALAGRHPFFFTLESPVADSSVVEGLLGTPKERSSGSGTTARTVAGSAGTVSPPPSAPQSPNRWIRTCCVRSHEGAAAQQSLAPDKARRCGLCVSSEASR